MDPEKKSLNFIFPTKYVIPKSLKFSHWPSKYSFRGDFQVQAVNFGCMGERVHPRKYHGT